MIIILGIIAGLVSVMLVISLWYIRGLLQIMHQMTSDVQEMQDRMIDFSKHLKNLYEMEMYYGDETLDQLVRHSREVVDSIDDFKNLFEVENEEEKTEED
jgi:hypothetical protein|tara:strand:- start:26340 stop:26639 length:300 start_codon:yes stop_codon:yes gene_type:complete